MRHFFLLLLLLLIQIQLSYGLGYYDNIIYQDDTYLLKSKPLEDYFDKHPSLKPNENGLRLDYMAIFEIKNNILILKDIKVKRFKGDNKSNWNTIIDKVFPNKEQRILDWFKGILVLPNGKMVKYICGDSIFKKYILLAVKYGKVSQEKRMKRKQFFRFKQRQFEAFKKNNTNEYKAVVKYYEKKWQFKKTIIDWCIQNSITLYTSKFLDN